MVAHLETFVEEGAAPDEAFFTSVSARSYFRRQDNVGVGDDWDDYPGDGGIRRVGIVARLERISVSPNTNTVVIDSEVNWKDRMVMGFVQVTGHDSTKGAVIPGGDGDAAGDHTDWGLTSDRGSFFGYTGSGESDGETYPSPAVYCIPIHESGGDDLFLFADATSGELKLEITSGYNFGLATVWLWIMATEQTGERTSPTEIPALPTNSNGQDLEPIDMNMLQDGGMLSQFRQGLMERDAEVENRTAGDIKTPSVCWPLGRRCEGNPKAPIIRKLRPQGGVWYGEETFYRRQNVAGAIRIAFSITGASGGPHDYLIDDAHDWRDRLVVYTIGNDETADIRPGGAEEDEFSDSGYLDTGLAYMGPGVEYRIHLNYTLDDNIQLYVHATTGALRLLKTGGGNARYIAGVMMGSFKLGPRS